MSHNNASNNKLLIYYQNVRGLRTKTEAFYRQLCVSSFDLIVLTETWLVDGISDCELFGDQYIVYTTVIIALPDKLAEVVY